MLLGLIDPIVVMGVVSVAAGYTWLVHRLTRGEGRSWPLRCCAWFAAGLIVVLVALSGPVGHYADLLLSVHMAEHMLLQFVAPPLLLLGRPVTLLLRSDPGVLPRRRLLRLLRSRIWRALTHPITAWSAFAATTVLTHLTPLYELTLYDGPLHELEHALYLATGLLFWAVVVQADPLPHRPSAPARILYLFLMMPVMALVGAVLAEAHSVLYHYYATLPPPWGPQALTDQHRAGAMMWEFGSSVILPVMAVLLLRWLDNEERDVSRAEAVRAELARRELHGAGGGRHGG